MTLFFWFDPSLFWNYLTFSSGLSARIFWRDSITLKHGFIYISCLVFRTCFRKKIGFLSLRSTNSTNFFSGMGVDLHIFGFWCPPWILSNFAPYKDLQFDFSLARHILFYSNSVHGSRHCNRSVQLWNPAFILGQESIAPPYVQTPLRWSWFLPISQWPLYLILIQW